MGKILFNISSVFLCIIFPSISFANDSGLELAEVRGESKLIQITNLDWNKELDKSSKACFIQKDQYKTVELLGDKSRIESGCMDYTVTDWDVVSEGGFKMPFTDSSDRYGLLDTSGQCIDNRIEQAAITTSKSLTVMPSYIDISSLKEEFLREMSSYYLGMLGGEVELSKQDNWNTEHISKNNLPKMEVSIDEYKLKRGVILHNTKIYFLKKNNSIAEKIQIADFWFRVIDMQNSLLLYENFTYTSWFMDEARAGYVSSYVSKARLENRYIGPFMKNGNIYFIQLSHGYESVWLELHEYYSASGEKPKIIRKWDYGC